MRGRPGAVLLEVLVAMAILAVAGAAALALASESARAVERARAADRATRDASTLLDAVALWPREDLDRHLGTREQGPWRMTVARESARIYVVTIVDSTGGDVVRTSIYRDERAGSAR